MILTLLGTNAAHLNAYSSAVKLLTVRPSSGSSLLVNGRLDELFATTCRYAIKSAIGRSSWTASSAIRPLLSRLSVPGELNPLPLTSDRGEVGGSPDDDMDTSASPCCGIALSAWLLRSPLSRRLLLVLWLLCDDDDGSPCFDLFRSSLDGLSLSRFLLLLRDDEPCEDRCLLDRRELFMITN